MSSLSVKCPHFTGSGKGRRTTHKQSKVGTVSGTSRVHLKPKTFDAEEALSCSVQCSCKHLWSPVLRPAWERKGVCMCARTCASIRAGVEGEGESAK